MKQSIGCVSVLVADYDEAIAYYTNVLGFSLVRDDAVAEGKRWVLVAPKGALECGLLLAKAKNNAERSTIGRQTAGRVFIFLHTDDFARDYRMFSERGVRFIESPREEAYGTVAVFEDFYGNRWDLLQTKKEPNQTLQPTAPSSRDCSQTLANKR
jgi:catechol 2,3-dioxygenase-like lactoylglutathione lyase family enzyme